MNSYFFPMDSRLFLVIPVLTCFLTLLGDCHALEPSGSCIQIQTKEKVRACSIGVVRVPTMSCPFVRGATSAAPVIVQPIAYVNTVRPHGDAPLNTIVCGAAPVVSPSRKICSSKVSNHIAPYVQADGCPKAPMVVQEPYRLNQRFCQ
jgi:hypothetical protein